MSPDLRALRALVGTRLLQIPSVAAVIHDDLGRVLVLQTPAGAWTLPAGAIDLGESPREAVVREVHEECGLRVVPVLIGVVGGRDYRTTYANGDRVEYTVCGFACEVVGGALRCDGVETIAWEWIHPAEVPSRLTFPWPMDWFARSRTRDDRDGRHNL